MLPFCSTSHVHESTQFYSLTEKRGSTEFSGDIVVVMSVDTWLDRTNCLFKMASILSTSDHDAMAFEDCWLQVDPEGSPSAATSIEEWWRLECERADRENEGFADPREPVPFLDERYPMISRNADRMARDAQRRLCGEPKLLNIGTNTPCRFGRYCLIEAGHRLQLPCDVSCIWSLGVAVKDRTYQGGARAIQMWPGDFVIAAPDFRDNPLDWKLYAYEPDGEVHGYKPGYDVGKDAIRDAMDAGNVNAPRSILHGSSYPLWALVRLIHALRGGFTPTPFIG